MLCRDEDDSMHSMGSMHVSRHNRKALALQKGKKANSSGLTADFTLKEADTVFGRPSEWSSPVADIETGLRFAHHEVPLLITADYIILHRHCCSGPPLTQKEY